MALGNFVASPGGSQRVPSDFIRGGFTGRWTAVTVPVGTHLLIDNVGCNTVFYSLQQPATPADLTVGLAVTPQDPEFYVPRSQNIIYIMFPYGDSEVYVTSGYATEAGAAAVAATGVTVSPKTFNLTGGGQGVQLAAVVAPANATNSAVTWSTSDATKAVVNSSGFVTAPINATAGTATITVTNSAGQTDTSVATVTAAAASLTPVTSFAVTPNQAYMRQGDTVQLVPVFNQGATNQTVTYTSDDPALVSVDSSGLLTRSTRRHGHTTIYATNSLGQTVQVIVQAIQATTVAGKMKPLAQYISCHQQILTNGVSGNLKGYACMWPHRMAAGAKVLQPIFPAWYYRDTGDGLCKNNGMAMPLKEAAYEYNGVTKPITFGGQRLCTIPDGAAGVLPDPLDCSAWGLSSFPADAVVVIKCKFEGATPFNIPYSTRQTGLAGSIGGAPGARSFFYDPAVTTVSSVDTPGDFNYPAGSANNFIVGYCPFFTGFYADPNTPALVIRGDSIPAGASGTTANEETGLGWANAIARNLKLGNFNEAVGGTRFLSGTLDSRYTNCINLGTHVIYMEGTNDFEPGGTVTAAQGIQFVQQADSLHKSFGINRTLYCCMLPRTLSTDNWTTLANQTVAGNNQTRIDFNTALKALSGIYGAAPMDSVRETTNLQLWKINITPDGLHPGQPGCVLLTNEQQPLVAAMIQGN